MFQFILRRVLPEGSNPADPQVRRRCGLAAGGIGVALNLTLFLGKLCAGALTGAISVTADAFNNLSDAAGSVVTLAGFRMAGQRADAEHPFGHGRVEYLAGLAVSLLILLVGVELGRESAGKILQPSETLLTPLDARTDVLATSAVLGGLAVSRLTHLNLDGWLGLAVAAFILRAGWSAAKDTIDPLLGAQPDPAMVADIESLILAHPPVLGIHDLIVHDYGPGRRMMSVHAEVPAASGLVEVHHVIDHIERELGERFGLEAVIHLDPVEPEDPLTRRLLALAAQAARELDPAATIHDLRRTAEGAVSFDVVVPYDVALTDGEVRAALSKRLEELEPGAGLVIGVDRSHVL